MVVARTWISEEFEVFGPVELLSQKRLHRCVLLHGASNGSGTGEGAVSATAMEGVRHHVAKAVCAAAMVQ